MRRDVKEATTTPRPLVSPVAQMADTGGAPSLRPAAGFLTIRPLSVGIRAVNGLFVKDDIPELHVGQVVACGEPSQRPREGEWTKTPTFPVGTKIVYKRLLGKVGDVCVVDAEDVIGSLE